MSTDDAENPTPPSQLPRLRFSLLAALLFITLVCIALGYAFRTRYCHATALFRVNSQKSTLWGDDAGQFDAREFEILQKTQISLIKSFFVLQSALRNPGIASLPIFAGKDDPVAWLAERIEVDFPSNSEILAISLRGNRVFANDVQMVVDAVAKAYEMEVVSAERNLPLLRHDAMVRKLSKLNKELASRMRDLQKLKADKGSDAVDLAIRQQEVETLIDIVRDLGRRLEIEDINAEEPDSSARIQKIQPAVVTFE